MLPIVTSNMWFVSLSIIPFELGRKLKSCCKHIIVALMIPIWSYCEKIGYCSVLCIPLCHRILSIWQRGTKHCEKKNSSTALIVPGCFFFGLTYRTGSICFYSMCVNFLNYFTRIIIVLLVLVKRLYTMCQLLES